MMSPGDDEGSNGYEEIAGLYIAGRGRLTGSGRAHVIAMHATTAHPTAHADAGRQLEIPHDSPQSTSA